MQSGTGFMCKCQPGFTGPKCDICDPCTPNPVNTFDIIFFRIFLYQTIKVYEHGTMSP